MESFTISHIFNLSPPELKYEIANYWDLDDIRSVFPHVTDPELKTYLVQLEKERLLELMDLTDNPKSLIDDLIELGDMEAIIWLYDQGYNYIEYAITVLLGKGDADNFIVLYNFAKSNDIFVELDDIFWAVTDVGREDIAKFMYHEFPDDNSMLRNAVRTDNFNLVKWLYNEDKISLRNNYPLDADVFYKAVMTADEDLIQWMIDHKADVLGYLKMKDLLGQE